MLIADVMLPGMNRIDLAAQMTRIFPDCKVLLFSGQTESSRLIEKARAVGIDFPLVAKPIHSTDLLARVAESLRK